MAASSHAGCFLLRSLIDNFLELEDALQQTLTLEKEVREWIANVFKPLCCSHLGIHWFVSHFPAV